MVVVVVNANARRFVESRSLLVDVDRLVEGRAILHVTRTRGELVEAARDARARDARVVVLCGGDGSYGAGVTAIEAAWHDAPALPVVALAPGGTVGTVARSLGVAWPGSTFEGIARAVHAAASARPSVLETPTLRVASEVERRVAFIFGTGLVASFFELYDPAAAAAQRAALGAERPIVPREAPSSGAGVGAAAQIVARVFVESFYGGAFARRVLEPLPCDVHVDGARLPWSASSLVVASVLRDLGLGMRVTWRGGEDPARPHVVVSGLPPRRLGPRMPRVLRGVPIGGPPEPHHDALASELRVVFRGRDGGDAPGGPFVIDGDLRVAREVSVRAGPTLRVLRPLTPASGAPRDKLG